MTYQLRIGAPRFEAGRLMIGKTERATGRVVAKVQWFLLYEYCKADAAMRLCGDVPRLIGERM